MVNVGQFNRRKRFSLEKIMNIRFSKKKGSSIIEMRVKLNILQLTFHCLNISNIEYSFRMFKF